jgi:hypothetical protein
MNIMTSEQIHNTGCPVLASGVSLAIGFNIHEVLGYATQVTGLLSALGSVAWIAYNFIQAYRNKRKAP